MQQTPSVQKPLPHSAFVAHVVASGLPHVPFVVALHTCAPVHAATPQQTPSVQCPLPHWLFAVQSVPSAPVVVHCELALQK